VGVNQVKISGTLVSIDAPRNKGWISCKALLETDGGWTVSIYATAQAAIQLSERFHPEDSVVVVGHLSRNPQGDLQIAAHELRPGDRPREPKGVREMGLNRMQFS
jgi:hypothetical protein